MTTARRFSLGDGMLLTGALAVALGLGTLGARLWPRHYYIEALTTVEVGLSLPAFCLSVAVGLAGLRGPARRVRRGVLRPGVAAGVAVAVRGVVHLFERFDYLPPANTYAYDRTSLFITTLVSPGPNAACVAAAWAVLALGGRWRPEASWPDRAGRALGFSWLAAAAVLPLVRWLGWFAG